MSSRSGLRSRRTRVYDCNYNMGEQYYKPVLDRMDRKLSGNSDIEERTEGRSKARLENSEASNLRQEAAFEDSLFDSRGARAARGRPLSTAIEDEDFDDEITSSLRRLRASKKASSFAEDVDLNSTLSSLENRTRLGISEKILDSVGIGKSDISAARRALLENEERTEKRISRRLKQEDEGNITRWTALKSSETEISAAAQRAKASRARLSDLEDEMNEMSARQAVREQRAANLRAFVADNDSEAVSSNFTLKMADDEPWEIEDPSEDAPVEETSAPETPANDVKPQTEEPTPAEPEESSVTENNDTKKLIFKHWVRPKFLQYGYLYDYQRNYYDDVIDFLDRRQWGYKREVPRAQTWAERALRTYTSKPGSTAASRASLQDRRLLAHISSGARFHRYHSKSLISRIGLS